MADEPNRADDESVPGVDPPVPAGIDGPAVVRWLTERVEVQTPVRFELIPGGRSNLTFLVTDASGRQWVLRRPPLRQVLATAHDMAREHRIIAALAPTNVAVAPLVGLCTDDDVNGAPFYVMDHVDGLVIRDVATAQRLSADGLRAAGENLIDTLAQIHAVDPASVGLNDLGRHDGYLARQLRRWYGQFEKSKLRDIPEVDAVHDALVATIPPQVGTAIVHGDYRLDNCLIGADGRVAAVLDWELCTLGDALADVGLLIVYTPDARDVAETGLPAPTALPGFPDRATLLRRYEDASGREPANIEYYVAFGYWKLACIIEGVYARYVGGAMGDHDPTTYSFLGDQVLVMANRAQQVLDGGI